MKEIKLRANKILVQPSQGTSSSFSMESRKYERKSVGIVQGVGDQIEGVEEGSTIIYDDSHSIDFTIEGIGYSIINPEDIAANIVEDK